MSERDGDEKSVAEDGRTDEADEGRDEEDEEWDGEDEEWDGEDEEWDGEDEKSGEADERRGQADEARGQADEGPVKDLVRRHWHGRADSFEAESHHGIHTDAQRERWLSVLREWGGTPPQRALDVGCGTGVVTRLLADLGHDVTGIDFAPAMLEAASRRAHRRNRAARDGRAIEFCAGDAEQLGLRDDAVDLLTARHLLWTLPNPATALREWRRVVRPGGRVLLVEGHWNHDEPWDEYEAVHDDLPLYDGRPPGALVDRLEAAGFRGIEHEPLQDPVLWGREPRHDYYVLVGDVPRRDR